MKCRRHAAHVNLQHLNCDSRRNRICKLGYDIRSMACCRMFASLKPSFGEKTWVQCLPVCVLAWHRNLVLRKKLSFGYGIRSMAAAECSKKETEFWGKNLGSMSSRLCACLAQKLSFEEKTKFRLRHTEYAYYFIARRCRIGEIRIRRISRAAESAAASTPLTAFVVCRGGRGAFSRVMTRKSSPA